MSAQVQPGPARSSLRPVAVAWAACGLRLGNGYGNGSGTGAASG